MFSFLRGKKDSFQKRRAQQDVWKCVRRIVDASSPNLCHANEQIRSDNRQNRCLPALVVPLAEEEPSVNEAIFALTRDFSDEGVSLLSSGELSTPHVICGFWDDGPLYFLGEVRHVRSFGAGFHEVGVHLCEVIPNGQFPQLQSLAAQLVPAESEDSSAPVELAGSSR